MFIDSFENSLQHPDCGYALQINHAKRNPPLSKLTLNHTNKTAGWIMSHSNAIFQCFSRVISKILVALFIVAAVSFGLFTPKVLASDYQLRCQCTQYVYRQRPDLPKGMGDAKDWLKSARYFRLPYNQVPQIGDVAVILNGEFGFSKGNGHVAIVIGVNAAHDRFDIAGWNGLKSNCLLEINTNLPVTPNTVFIHRHDPFSSPMQIQPFTNMPAER